MRWWIVASWLDITGTTFDACRTLVHFLVRRCISWARNLGPLLRYLIVNWALLHRLVARIRFFRFPLLGFFIAPLSVTLRHGIVPHRHEALLALPRLLAALDLGIWSEKCARLDRLLFLILRWLSETNMQETCRNAMLIFQLIGVDRWMLKTLQSSALRNWSGWGVLRLPGRRNIPFKLIFCCATETLEAQQRRINWLTEKNEAKSRWVIYWRRSFVSSGWIDLQCLIKALDRLRNHSRRINYYSINRHNPNAKKLVAVSFIRFWIFCFRGLLHRETFSSTCRPK